MLVNTYDAATTSFPSHDQVELAYSMVVSFVVRAVKNDVTTAGMSGKEVIAAS